MVVEADVAEALDAQQTLGLRRRRLRGRAPAPDHPLIGRPDVLLTPHSAAQTEEGLRNMATWIAEDVLGVLRGEAPRNPVNDPKAGQREPPAAGAGAARSERVSITRSTRSGLRNLVPGLVLGQGLVQEVGEDGGAAMAPPMVSRTCPSGVMAT